MTQKAPEQADAYLIEKRGLYYRPEASGYTGIKDEAGRYTLEQVAVRFPNMDSPNQDGMIFHHEDDAPEYSASCAWDVKLVHKVRREERNHALALVAAAYEDAATKINYMRQDAAEAYFWAECAAYEDAERAISNLTPDAAHAALERRDARIRNEALREALVNLRTYAPHLVDGPEHDVGYYHGYQTALNRVLALMENQSDD